MASIKANKDKGTAWETAIVDLLRAWSPFVERRRLGGRADRGDIAGIPGVVIEAKAESRIDLAGWLAEAHRERDNATASVGVVWAKRRGRTGAEHGYVIMDGLTFVNLLAAADWLPQHPATHVEDRGVTQ